MAVLNVDFASAGYNKISGEVSNLDNKIKKSESSVDNLSKGFKRLAVQVAGVVSAYKALDFVTTNILKNGLDYNKTIENQTQGLTALIVATSSNTSAMGKALTLQEKYILANKEANLTLEKLVSLNNETPQSLEQTIQVYKSLLPTLGQVGASQKDLLNVTKSLAVASNAYGLEFNQLLAGVDGLATGTVLANSDLGRFLNTIGLSNEALKESDNVVELLTDRLSDFNVKLDTVEVATSNFNNAWDDLTKKITKDVFVAQKESLKSITTYLNNIDEKKISSMAYTVNSLVKGSISTISVILRFINSTRIMFEDIGTGLFNVWTNAKIIFKELQLDILELTSTIRQELFDTFGKDAFDFLGIDVPKKAIQNIKILKGEIAGLYQEINLNNLEFNKFLDSTRDVNQVILDIEKAIKKAFDFKQVKKELEDLLSGLNKVNDIENNFSPLFTTLKTSFETALIEAVESKDLEASLETTLKQAGKGMMQSGLSSGNYYMAGGGFLLSQIGTNSKSLTAEELRIKSNENARKSIESFTDSVEKATKYLGGFGNTTTSSLKALDAINEQLEINKKRYAELHPYSHKDELARETIRLENLDLLDQKMSTMFDLTSDKINYEFENLDQLISKLGIDKVVTSVGYQAGIGYVSNGSEITSSEAFSIFMDESEKVMEKFNSVASAWKSAQMQDDPHPNLINRLKNEMESLISENEKMLLVTEDYSTLIAEVSKRIEEANEAEKERLQLIKDATFDKGSISDSLAYQIASLTDSEEALNELRLKQISSQMDAVQALTGVSNQMKEEYTTTFKLFGKTKTWRRTRDVDLDLEGVLDAINNLDVSAEDYEDTLSAYEQYASLLLEEAQIKKSIADAEALAQKELQEEQQKIIDEQIKAQEELYEKSKKANESIQDTINKILGITDSTTSQNKFLQLSEFNRLISQYKTADSDTRSELLTDILSLGGSLGSDVALQKNIVSSLDAIKTNLTASVGDYVQDVNVPNSTTSVESNITSTAQATQQSISQSNSINTEILDAVNDLNSFFNKITSGSKLLVQIAG